jgi:hypothetical protein
MATVINEIGDQTQQPNAGWVREIVLIEKTDIISMVDPSLEPNDNVGMVFLKDLQQFKAEALITRIMHVWRTNSFNETPIRTANGLIYDTSLAFQVAKNNAEFHKWLLENEHREFIAVFRDGNDIIYIAGNTTVGLELGYNRTITDNNLYGVALAGQITTPAWHTDAESTAQMFEFTEFSNEFNLEFG